MTKLVQGGNLTQSGKCRAVCLCGKGEGGGGKGGSIDCLVQPEDCTLCLRTDWCEIYVLSNRSLCQLYALDLSLLHGHEFP